MRKKIILIIAITGILTSALAGYSESAKTESITTVPTTMTEMKTKSTTEQTVAITRGVSTTSKKVTEETTKGKVATTKAAVGTTKKSNKVTQKAVKEKVATPSTSKATTTKKITTTEKQINIREYESYAKTYANQIGLTLDSTATSWDNPITITSKTTTAKESIKDKLDWYKDTGITSV